MTVIANRYTITDYGVISLIAAIFHGDKATTDSPEQIDICLHCDRPDCKHGHCGRVNDSGIDTGFVDGSRAYILDGRRITVPEMADMFGISRPWLYMRLKRGETPEQIFEYYMRRGA